THTVKRPLRAGQRVKVERRIPARHYLALLSDADPGRHTVKKRRRCFLWHGQYWELDVFLEPRPGLMLLSAEVGDESRPAGPPPFVEVERDVTGAPAFTNYALAAIPPSPPSRGRGEEETSSVGEAPHEGADGHREGDDGHGQSQVAGDPPRD